MDELAKEILRKQLKLLAEVSKEGWTELLPDISRAMCEIARTLNESRESSEK